MSPFITRHKGNLKERNGEERVNEYVVTPPQGHEIWYANESPYNQKKNETEVIILLRADEINHSLKRTHLIIVTLLLIYRDSLNILMRKYW